MHIAQPLFESAAEPTLAPRCDTVVVKEQAENLLARSADVEELLPSFWPSSFKEHHPLPHLADLCSGLAHLCTSLRKDDHFAQLS